MTGAPPLAGRARSSRRLRDRRQSPARETGRCACDSRVGRGAPRTSFARLLAAVQSRLRARCTVSRPLPFRDRWPSRRREPRAPAATSAAPTTRLARRGSTVPALPQPAAAASGLPDLRHLRGARGDQAHDRRPDGAAPTPGVALAWARRHRRPRRLRRRAGLRRARRGRPPGGRRRDPACASSARRRSSASMASTGSRWSRPRSGSATRRTRSPRCGPSRRPRSCAPPPTSPRAMPTAMVSPGSTGATMAAATFGLRRLQGVQRPALAVQLPVPGKPVLFLDVGANVEVRAQHLVQFAFLGAAFSEAVLGVERPRVGLLSVGEEAGKGTRGGRRRPRAPRRGAGHRVRRQRRGARPPAGGGRRRRHRRLHRQRLAEADGGHGEHGRPPRSATPLAPTRSPRSAAC